MKAKGALAMTMKNHYGEGPLFADKPHLMRTNWWCLAGACPLGNIPPPPCVRQQMAYNRYQIQK